MSRNPHLFEVDESLERLLMDESLDGKHSLFHDMRRGHHAKLVLAEIDHAKAIKALGEQKAWGGDAEMRLVGLIPAAAYHTIAAWDDSYETWDDTSKSGRLAYIKRKHPENNIRIRASKTTISVGNKYGPPAL